MISVTLEYNGASMMIHNPRSIDTTQKIIGGTIVQAVNAFDSLQFTIFNNNEGYEYIVPFKTKIRAYSVSQARYEFVGRVLTVSPEMSSDGKIYKTVVCEGRQAYLCDSRQPYIQLTLYEGDENRTGLEEFIDILLANHNAEVEPEKQIQRGNITLTTTENVYKGLNYECTWNAIKSKLVDVYGGEVRLREDGGTLYLDYADAFGTVQDTAIEIAVNMQSVRREVNPTSIVTRLIPLGAKQTTETEEILSDGTVGVKETQTENRLTIESVNDGEIYIEDETAAAEYGRIYDTVIFDDVTVASNLLSKGIEWLSENNRLHVKHTITALDLSEIGQSYDDFRLYDSYPVRNALVGVDDTLRVVKKTINIDAEYKSSLEFGDKFELLSDAISKVDTEIREIGRVIDESATEQKNSYSDAISYVNTSVASVKAYASNIRAYVEDNTVTTSIYEEFERTVRNILQMDADGTTMIFTTIERAVSSLGGTVEENYRELTANIRFYADASGKPVIELGQTDNPLRLLIKNDRITFQQNGIEVAYFSDNKLYVTDAEFLNSLILGKFAFKPRDNGNLSFVKIR